MRERRRVDGGRLLGTRQLNRLATRFPIWVIAALLAGCGGGGDGADALPRLTLVETYGVAYYLPESSEGVGVSHGVVNHTDRALEITAVYVEADPELEVNYIGWSTCRRGCFGTAHWKTIVADMAKGQMVPDGKLPVPLTPNGETKGGFGPVSLEFRVILGEQYHDDPAGCFHVKRITVDLASGERGVPVTSLDGDHPLAVQARRTNVDDACKHSTKGP